MPFGQQYVFGCLTNLNTNNWGWRHDLKQLLHDTSLAGKIGGYVISCGSGATKGAPVGAIDGALIPVARETGVTEIVGGAVGAGVRCVAFMVMKANRIQNTDLGNN